MWRIYKFAGFTAEGKPRHGVHRQVVDYTTEDAAHAAIKEILKMENSNE